MLNICPTCYGSNFIARGNIAERDMAICEFQKIRMAEVARFEYNRLVNSPIDISKLPDDEKIELYRRLEGIKMKINWKIRLRNKVWLASMASLVISFVYGLLDLLGVVPAVSQIRVLEIVQSVLTFLGVIGVIVDPTTAGLGDSNRALSYRQPWDDTANLEG